MPTDHDAGCLRQEELSALLDGSLAGPAGRRAISHVKSCPSCRSHLIALKRSSGVRRAPLGHGRSNAKANLRPDDHPGRQVPSRPEDPDETIDLGIRSADTRHVDETLPSLPGYEVLQVIARGGMGIVLKARHASLKRLVAIKLPLANMVASKADRERFLREGQSAARLRHPNICTVYDVGEVRGGGRPYLAMAFVDGLTLRDWATQSRPRGRQAAEILAKVARAVAHAHDHGVIHRDIKPSNILIDAASHEPVLTDFGLAKEIGDGAEPGATLAGQILGTPQYMAPEQAAGDLARIGPHTDVYAVGAVLYYLLTLQAPFKGATGEVLRAVQSDLPPTPRRLSRDVHIDLETICLKAMAKLPEDRYASATAMAEDLERFAAGEPILARREPIAQRVFRLTKRHWKLVAGFAVLLLGAGIVMAIQAGRATEANERTAAGGLVKRLLDADTAQVPSIVAELQKQRTLAEPLLRTEHAKAPPDSRQRLHTSLALLPSDSGQVDYLCGRLLLAEPQDAAVIRNALAPHSSSLLSRLWAAAGDPAQPEGRGRLRAAAALAAYAPQDEKWGSIQPGVADDLIAVPGSQLAAWMESLRPVRKTLVDPLTAACLDPARGEGVRSRALEILLDYAADQPAILATLLMEADERQFALIYPKFAAHADKGVPVLTAELDLKPPAYMASSDARREQLAERQANAAVALLWLNQPAKVWPLLQHTPDPRVRSHLIHRLGPMGIDASVIINRLYQEPDVSASRALILSLGEFSDQRLSGEQRAALITKLKHNYTTQADPGLHAAVEWLLRLWQQDAWLAETNTAWAKDWRRRNEKLVATARTIAKDKSAATPQWYVTGKGHTMVVIPGPVEFKMGSPESEPGRSNAETVHTRRIGRAFAIAAKPVTIGEYQEYDGRLLEENLPPNNLPVTNLTWYQAAAYCNWLSEMEGIPRAEWCYSINLDQQMAWRSPGHRDLAGYRLPTEAEIEFATRSGSITSRYFGQSDQLLPKYAWFDGNSGNRAWPVGTRKPNDLGLFDLHGNVGNWCTDRFRLYPVSEPGEIVEDKDIVRDDDEEERVEPNMPQVVRGGPYFAKAEEVRSAFRWGQVPGNVGAMGFRPARTVKLEFLETVPDEDPAKIAARSVLSRELAVVMNQGIEFGKQGRPDDAIACFKRAIDLDPTSAETYGALGAVYGNAKLDYDSAIACFKRFIELSPRDVRGPLVMGNAQVRKGLLDEAIASFRKACELSAQHPSAKAELARAQRLAAARDKLAAYRAGSYQPATSAERIDLAQWCRIKKLHQTAAILYRSAFVADPKLADNVWVPHRYFAAVRDGSAFGVDLTPDDNLWAAHRFNAACSASLAAAGRGDDAAGLGDQERTRLRQQAIDWLRADLTLLEVRWPTDRVAVLSTLRRWQNDSDLSDLRDAAALAKVPANQQKACTQLWADVAVLTKKLAPR